MTSEGEELLAALLTRDPHGSVSSETMGAQLLVAARAHGVQALIGDRVHLQRIGMGWPPELREAFIAEARAHALAEPLHFLELNRILEHLDGAGVPALLLKGAHLAYAYYARPGLRPFSDVDVLIRRDDRQRIARLMHALGYVPARYVSGELVSHQDHYERWDEHGIHHEIDVHWKISNPQIFAGLLPFDECMAEAVAIPKLCEQALGLSARHALLFACVHRVAHHNASRRLVWLYDMHLIASAMTPEHLAAFCALASEKQVRAICASGLELVQRRFDTRVPSFCMETLTGTAQAEPSADFLIDRRSKFDELVSDLRFLGWRDGARLLREHLIPPPEWVCGPDGNRHKALLPWLYVRRAVLGARRWMRRPHQ